MPSPRQPYNYTTVLPLCQLIFFARKKPSVIFLTKRNCGGSRTICGTVGQGVSVESGVPRKRACRVFGGSRSLSPARRSRYTTATTEKKPRKEDKTHPIKPYGLPGTPKQKGAGEPAPVHKDHSLKSLLYSGDMIKSFHASCSVPNMERAEVCIGAVHIAGKASGSLAM